MGSHDRLGTQVFPLKMLIPNEPKEVTLDLLKDTSATPDPHNKKQRGQLFLELNYAPFREDNESFSGLLDSFSRKDSIMDRAPSNICTTGAGLLLVTVQGAQDVEGSRHNNPYVVLIFRGETKKSKVHLYWLNCRLIHDICFNCQILDNCRSVLHLKYQLHP